MKKNRLAQLIQEYSELTSKGKSIRFFDFLRDRDPWVFAHHPKGDAFADHVWCVRDLYLCKGCVCTITGMILGLFLYAISGWLDSLNTPETAISFIFLLIPTTLSSLLGFPRVVKNISRVLLGVLLISSLIFLFVSDDLWGKLIVLIVYILVRIPLQRKRDAMNDKIHKNSCKC